MTRIIKRPAYNNYIVVFRLIAVFFALGFLSRLAHPLQQGQPELEAATQTPIQISSQESEVSDADSQHSKPNSILPVSTVSSASVPILMYHEIGPAKKPFTELYVAPEDFRKQMAYLKTNGYTGITMEQAHAAWSGLAQLPEKPVVITFDDGYVSTYSEAFPVLRENDLIGVLFLELNMLSHIEGISNSQVKEWVSAGFELGSHTISHPDLTTLDKTAQLREIRDSKHKLEEMFDIPIKFFCYPSGKYNQEVVESVKTSGYLGALTIKYGLGNSKSLFEIKRIRVDRSDGLQGFIRKLETIAKSE